MADGCIVCGGSDTLITGPETLREYRPDEVWIVNPIYEKEIAAQLAEMGVDARVVSV